MWRQEHADADLEPVPADMVMASGSGLDPHITLKNAQYQLDRVAAKRAADANREPAQVRKEIEDLLQKHKAAPLGRVRGPALRGESPASGLSAGSTHGRGQSAA